MWLTNIDFNVDQNSIDPRFFFRVDFEYYENLEIPLTFNGFIKTSDDKRIAKIDSEYDNYYGSNNNISIPLVDEYRKNIIRRDEKRTLHRNFSAQISQNSINHIEKLRLIDPQKRVFLNIDLEIVIFKYNNSEKKEIIIDRYNGTRQVEIAHSEWLNKYAPKLGIGEFLIIEFPKHSIQVNHQIKNDWIDKIDRAKTRLDEMNAFMNEGQWEKVIESSRKIWDIFKFRKDDKESKESLKLLFSKNNYSDVGFNDFLDSIWSMHEFASKFIHDKGKKDGEMNPIPVPKKEDAYFIFLWAMGFVNMLNEKVKGLEQ